MGIPHEPKEGYSNKAKRMRVTIEIPETLEVFAPEEVCIGSDEMLRDWVWTHCQDELRSTVRVQVMQQMPTDDLLPNLIGEQQLQIAIKPKEIPPRLDLLDKITHVQRQYLQMEEVSYKNAKKMIGSEAKADSFTTARLTDFSCFRNDSLH
jgi:hypothetical protein